MFWKTLRLRIAFWIAGLLLAILLTFTVFVYVSLRQSLYATLDDSLRLSASQISASLNSEDGKLSISDIPFEEAQPILREQGLTFRIFDPAGNLVQSFGRFKTLPTSPAPPQQPEVSTTADPTTGEPVRLLTVPLVDNAKVIGSLQVGQSLANIETTLSRMLAALVISLPVLGVAAGGGGYFLAKRALRPIDDITCTARRISAEDLSARLALPQTDDEVGRLAATLDDMLNRLDASFKRERQFTADASHELRTPLTAMQSILGMIQAKRRTPEEYERALGDLAEETDRLHTLAENLLEIARSESHSVLNKETIDLSNLLGDVAESLRPLAEEKGLSLQSDIAHELAVQGDSDSLIRLFANLIHNAIKYTGQGKVWIGATRQSERLIQVTIRDTGCGIPADSLPHIFERFYRVEASRTARGVGLGLTIAQSIAHAHGGNITVHSILNTGTTFTVTLPTEDA
jgi:heavy metal sensor kinase